MSPSPAPDRAIAAPAASTGAPLLRRLLAFALDYLVLAVWGAALFALSPLLPDGWFDAPLRAQLTGFLLLTLPVVLYFAFGESSPWQGTLGKRALGVAVAREDVGAMVGSAAMEGSGAPPARATRSDAPDDPAAPTTPSDRIHLSTALLRNAVKFLPWELAHTFVWRSETWPEAVTIGGSSAAMLLMVLFAAPMLTGGRRRAVWDRTAGTTVRRR